jgi:neutral ceramidase
MSYLIGSARIDITPKSRNIPMMGWGDVNHLALGVTTPLYARAVVIVDDSGKRLIMVCLDICFTTELIRTEVLRRLNLNEDELMISATHTHSAPGGYSSFIFYSLCTDGFQEEVFESYTQGTVQAIQSALANVKPGTVKWITGEFPLDQQVVFNRSVRAWNRNPETEKSSPWQRERATNREMRLLRFDDLNGNPIASWNWFSVHATSMHRRTNKIHSDNKGVAATMLEDHWRQKGFSSFVGVFAQGAAGDVSPNFMRHSFWAEKSGPSKNDEESCNFNANLQFRKALELMLDTSKQEALEGTLHAQLEYHDFSDVRIEPDLVNGRVNARTGQAEVGLPQFYGTAEGRGLPWWVVKVIGFCYRIAQIMMMERWNRPIQGVKKTLVSAGSAEVFGASIAHKMVIPDFVHPSIMLLKRWSKRGALENRPLVPQILPVQIIRIGTLAIAAVPAEFTTVAGWRLEKLIHHELKHLGVTRAVTQGYANAHSSYVTTPEEYDQQSYEGGCTFFGRETLPAYLSRFRQLCSKIREGQPSSYLKPKRVDQAYLTSISSPQ